FMGCSDTTPLRGLRRRGARISFRYAANGQLCEIVDSLARSMSVKWDQAGKILGLFLTDLSSHDKRRPLMVYEYDAVGNLVVGRDMYNGTVRFCWDLHNRMISRTDRRGYSFHFAYDEEGRCVHSHGDDGLLEVSLDYQPHLKTTMVRRGDGGQSTYVYND